jgi:PleD family two-component response regulator
MHQQRGVILLVDGDTRRSERLSSRLAQLGLEVRTARDGATALLKAHELRPDVVVSATELPVLDGYRMLDALRSRPETAEMPAVLIVDGSDHDALTRGWKAGADLCIPATQGDAELFATVRRALISLWEAEDRPFELALVS